MFILIEVDKDWTWGVDWYKHSKGIRLGFFAIHVCNVKFDDFLGTMSEAYHREKLRKGKDNVSP